MRLSEKIMKDVVKNLTNFFGDAEFYLFGSQTDMSKKGGDVDIAIKSDLSKDEFNKRKMLFIMKMEDKYPELEFDIVNFNQIRDADFIKEIESSKIQINYLNNS